MAAQTLPSPLPDCLRGLDWVLSDRFAEYAWWVVVVGDRSSRHLADGHGAYFVGSRFGNTHSAGESARKDWEVLWARSFRHSHRSGADGFVAQPWRSGNHVVAGSRAGAVLSALPFWVTWASRCSNARRA